MLYRGAKCAVPPLLITYYRSNNRLLVNAQLTPLPNLCQMINCITIIILPFSEKSSWVIYSAITLHWFAANTSSLKQLIHHLYSQSSLLNKTLLIFRLHRVDYCILFQKCQSIFLYKGHLFFLFLPICSFFIKFYHCIGTRNNHIILFITMYICTSKRYLAIMNHDFRFKRNLVL